MRGEKEIVEKLIKKYRYNDPFYIAKELGITVLHEELKEILGYFNRYNRMKMIHINHTLSEQKKIFICAHELGHAVQHPNVNTPFLKRYTLFSTDRIEREANKFAVELLMPDSLLREYANCPLANIAMLCGIPKELVYLKETRTKFF